MSSLAEGSIIMIKVEVFELPPIGTNCWVLSKEASDEVVVVDAPLNAFATVERKLVQNGLRVAALLMTHGHWDHTLDGWRFNEFGVPVYGNEQDKAFYENPAMMSSFAIPGLEMKPMRIDHWVGQGSVLDLLGEAVEVREVPGHSPGSLLFWFRESGVAASGDAIFQGSIGRTDFPGCSFEQLEKSIVEQIYTLPANTRLLPGHGPETAVSAESRGNPFVRINH